jgi:hypothetical protein
MKQFALVALLGLGVLGSSAPARSFELGLVLKASSSEASTFQTEALFDLEAVAKLNQGSFVVDADRATLKFGLRIVYLFKGSAEIIVDGRDVRLESAVVIQNKRWAAPSSLLEALQLRAPKPLQIETFVDPFLLNWEDLELKPGARGLHLFWRAEGSSIDEASVFLMPFDQLSKVDSKLNLQKVVGVLNSKYPGRILYFAVAADSSGFTPDQLEFIQGGTRYIVEQNAGLYSFEGQFPRSSLGAIKLPASFNLREPIRIIWGSSAADYVFAP